MNVILPELQIKFLMQEGVPNGRGVDPEVLAARLKSHTEASPSTTGGPQRFSTPLLADPQDRCPPAILTPPSSNAYMQFVGMLPLDHPQRQNPCPCCSMSGRALLGQIGQILQKCKAKGKDTGE